MPVSKISESNPKLSLAECRKILNTGGVFYTNEEVIELRDWLYHMADIVFDTMDREESKRQIDLIKNGDEIENNNK